MNTTTKATTRTIKVKTYSWERYGNTVASPDLAMAELIDNAYSACKKAAFKEVCIRLTEDAATGEYYLLVLNTGKPATSIKDVLDYGACTTRMTALNQFGTGFKTAASFFNPANDDWAFYTRKGEKTHFAKAPYSERMKEYVTNDWLFDARFVSCARIKVQDDSIVKELQDEATVRENLGYRYSYAIKSGLRITYNNIPVTAIFPVPAEGNEDEEDVESIARVQSYRKQTSSINIDGVSVPVNYEFFVVGKDSATSKYYERSQANGGVYIFANNHLISKEGVDIIEKRNGKATLIPHTSIASRMVLVNVMLPDNHSAEIPLLNNKSGINWRKTAGRLLKEDINKLAGDFFRNPYYASLESDKRKYLDRHMQCFMPTKYNCGYISEYKLKNCKFDAIIGERNSEGEILPENIARIIEYKRGRITKDAVSQVMKYYIYLANYCESIGKTISDGTDIYLVGSEIDEDVEPFVKCLNKHLKNPINFVIDLYDV